MPSGIGSLSDNSRLALEDGSRALLEKRALGSDAPIPDAGVSSTRTDGTPRVIEGPRTLAGRAQEELAFERAAAQLRPSWASDGGATPSTIRPSPAAAVSTEPAAQQAEPGATQDAPTTAPAVSRIASTEVVTAQLAEPISFAALTPSQFAPAPGADDTRALRAALHAPKRQTRVIALASAGCLLLGAMIALFAGSDGSDVNSRSEVKSPSKASPAASPAPINKAGHVPAQQPAKVPAAEPAQHAAAPAMPERALQPSRPALPVAKASPVKVAAKPALAAPKPALGKSAPPAAKPAPARPTLAAAKAAPGKAALLTSKPGPAKASLVASKPGPAKAMARPALQAKTTAVKPTLLAKPHKGAPAPTKATPQPSKGARSNPVDVLNPWAN